MKRLLLLVLTLAFAAGCKLVERLPRFQEPPVAQTTASQYHLEGWDWKGVSRVLVLPLRNESAYTRSGEEMQAALTSELQRLGRFEVVAATPEHLQRLSTGVHQNGVFDETVLWDIAKETRADVVIHGTITHYSPYPRPRIGVVIQAVSPAQGKVVASVDGLWDTTDAALAEKIRMYYRQQTRPLPPRIRNSTIAKDDSFATELSLDSPALFQRYICHQVSRTLIGEPDAILQTGGRFKLGAGLKTAPCDGCEPTAPTR